MSIAVLAVSFEAASKNKKPHAIEIPAINLDTSNSDFIRIGNNLGVLSDKANYAEISYVPEVNNGIYNIELHSFSEYSGRSNFELIVGGTTIGSFNTELLNEDKKSIKVIKVFQEIEMSEGELIKIRATNGSRNSKDYSQALWNKLIFIPISNDPGKAASALYSQRSEQEIESGPSLVNPRMPDGNGSVEISGELRQWHPVTLTMQGPFAHEQDLLPNPFLDYRMSVTFSHESGYPQYTVPGYFAADGNAVETSANKGTAWKAMLSPDKKGKWFYKVSFVKGKGVAVNPAEGEYLLPYQGVFGTFYVDESNKKGRDFRSKGRLQYVGHHLLRFAGSGDFFLKAGTDAPETILAYNDFDNTVALKASVPLKTWAPHAQDANHNDPTWQKGKGKNLLGAINYLAETGANAISFLTYNAGGDGDNVWPYVERNGKRHFDVSKLEQWDRIFTHAQEKGIYLHFKLQENELDDNRIGSKKKNGIVIESLDGGKLGLERKLYLREIIARYGHHLALNWNIGEENTQSYEEQRDMAEYILNVDAYDHNLIIHSFPSQQETVYQKLLGSQSVIMGASLQNHWSKAHQQTLRWITASSAAGKPWVVANDEQNPAGLGVPPDPGYKGFDGYAVDKSGKYNLHDIRKYTLWGNIMAGGAGVEYYFGYRLPENDLVAQDLRSRDLSWRYAGIAVKFFEENKIPLHRMRNLNSLVGNTTNNNEVYCLGNEGELYLVYLPKGGKQSIDLSKYKGEYSLTWFNPRKGGALMKGEITRVKAGGIINLGVPPKENLEDWLAVLKKL